MTEVTVDTDAPVTVRTLPLDGEAAWVEVGAGDTYVVVTLAQAAQLRTELGRLDLGGLE